MAHFFSEHIGSVTREYTHVDQFLVLQVSTAFCRDHTQQIRAHL
jgi:hypothetical protein